MRFDPTPQEIEEELAQARQRLSDNLAMLVSEVHPRAVIHRSVAGAKEQGAKLLDDGLRRARESLVKLTRLYSGREGREAQILAIAATMAVVTMVICVGKKK